MAALVTKPVHSNTTEDIPQWKKDLIARLRTQNKKTEERLWMDHHPPHHLPLQAHHPHPRTDLVCPMSPENGFRGKDADSPGSSDSEDLHYGPGIVNRLRNKYLSLALRESNTRPTILRKATSLENLLDDEDEGGKEDTRLFARRNVGNDGGNRYRSSNRRQEMKRARSVEVISRTTHEEELTMTSSVTAKINNRQSLHEDLLAQNHEETPVLIENTRPYKKPVSIENGAEEPEDKYSRRINRPKRIPPLLNEKEKPPVDVVKHAKMIFEKRPETRTKKPHQTGEVAAKINSFNSMIVKTKLASQPPWKSVKHVKPVPNGDVAAKVDCFNDIIVKTKVALKSTKPAIKSSKPVFYDKCKSNTHHHVRPVAKPVILNEEIVKPKSLEIRSPREEKKSFSSLPSPIPDVSRVDIKHQDGSDTRNNPPNSLCETPDLILTSSPISKITSPTYRKRSTENFIMEERNRSFLAHTEATNKFISPIHSPTRSSYTKPTSLNFNREEMDSPGIKMISPISQNNITKSSASSVFNFMNSQVDQRHLPSVKQKSPILEYPKSKVNGLSGENNVKNGLSSFEIEKNLRNSVKSSVDSGDNVASVDEESEKEVASSESELIENVSKKLIESAPMQSKKPEDVVREKDKLSQEVIETKPDDSNTSAQNFGNSVEKTSSIFENLGKTGKNVFELTYKSSKAASEPSDSVEQTRNVIEEPDNVEKIEESPKLQGLVEDKTAKGQIVEKIDRSVLKPVQSKSASDKNSVGNCEEKPVKIVLPKKTKPRQEESTIAVFNFTSRKDVPDYISNDTSRSPSRPVIPKPDEPGIKLLPEAFLANFKEIQEVWEEDELIRSLEARPPSPCDVTFINDNILIDGKSSLIQHSSKRVKLKISFVDDAEIYEYPSETSLLEDSHLPTLGGSAQVGHSVPTLSGSSLATYTPKTTEDFQLGITKSFQEATTKPDVTDPKDEPQTNVLVEEIEKPVLFSSGSTSDILF